MPSETAVYITQMAQAKNGFLYISDKFFINKLVHDQWMTFKIKCP